MKVLVIAGTADAKEIVRKLAEAGIQVTATVTTGYGRSLLEGLPGVQVLEGKLAADGMAVLIRDIAPDCLVDASHPFAREASVNALAACKSSGVPYLRFERRHVPADGIGQAEVIRVRDFEEAARKADSIDGKVFLTTGSNHLGEFIRGVGNFKERLVARVLPDSRVIEKCEKAGLSAGSIIAMKGPFSMEMNVEMLKQVGAAVLVTKDSGETGGMPEKLAAAAKLDIPVILVERPDVEYGNCTDSMEELLEMVLHRRF